MNTASSNATTAAPVTTHHTPGDCTDTLAGVDVGKLVAIVDVGELVAVVEVGELVAVAEVAR